MTASSTCTAKTQPCPAGTRCRAYRGALALVPTDARPLVAEVYHGIAREVSEVPCRLSEGDYANPAELGDDSLLRGITLVRCDRHGTYHRVQQAAWHETTKTAIIACYTHIATAAISDEARTNLRAQLGTTRESQKERQLQAHTLLATWRQDFNDNPVDRKAFYRAMAVRAEQHAAEPKTHQPITKKAGNPASSTTLAAVPLLVGADKLTPAQLLHFQVCGRKTAWEDETEANLYLRASRNTDEKEAYRCPYGNHYHVGKPNPHAVTQDSARGVGEPTPRQLARAKKTWNIYHAKANAYAKKLGLLPT